MLEARLVKKGIVHIAGGEDANYGKLRGGSTDSPVTTVAIDNREKIRGFLPFVDQVLPTSLVALSDVEAVRYTHEFRSNDRGEKVQ